MKKHKELEAEVKVHEQLVRTVQNNGEHLIDEEHFATEDIIRNSKMLKEAWEGLIQSLKERKRSLSDSLELQKVGRK